MSVDIVARWEDMAKRDAAQAMRETRYESDLPCDGWCAQHLPDHVRPTPCRFTHSMKCVDCSTFE